ncbi:hypothetical protein R1sor_014628 [Riccia sorocarpa]|uniref:Transmembrane protein n=1 Tax=Riccia sorocarpa TaxID=122646 RepID=A0ABD3HCS9_9MARC
MGVTTEAPRARLGVPSYHVAQWNVFTIIRDAFKLSLRPPLPLILFSLVLPSTLLSFYEVIHNSSIFSPSNVSLLSQHGEVQAPSMSFTILATLLIEEIVYLIISSFVLGSVAYATVSIHQGKSLTLFEVIRAVHPLWGKIFVTTLIYTISTLVITGVQLLVKPAAAYIAPSPDSIFPVMFAVLVISIVSLILQTMIGIVYSVAASVSCFEEQNYGVAAFKRAKKLLQKKWRTAVGLYILFLIAVIVILVPVMGVFINQKLTPDKWSEWTPVLVITFFGVIDSYLIEVHYICWALFYLACVADSEENSTIHREDLLEAGLNLRSTRSDASV